MVVNGTLIVLLIDLFIRHYSATLPDSQTFVLEGVLSFTTFKSLLLSFSRFFEVKDHLNTSPHTVPVPLHLCLTD